ncbi:putative inorganic carbon transporter subunit DabA [uncultured Dokdonia sp.]|uniref:putative inorganic carbon transporter subunit DabA n=1 Tax=uncultured Dokdonia sp. TaxID=575653 RepID=UPI00344C027D
MEKSKFWNYFLKRMKNMLPSAFGYVEGSGIFYGIASFARTITPGYSYRLKTKNATTHEAICQPKIELSQTPSHDDSGISLQEKVAIVKSAFDLTGWKNFAPLVLFVGHGSHSANNPFGSSLDCGACAASPGRHNARMLAKLANISEVRHQLAVEHQLVIPASTIFIGAEHNTTTDEITIFDAEVPDTHQEQLQKVKTDLYKAQQTATQERLSTKKNSIALAQEKANNWGETRPEWGLAKNAGFIIAPRELTKNVHLDSRCFLHSYDWKMDTTGKALEGILQGPMVVTQWINNHYYFSTVDNETFGGGSKITHNITGKFGVVQGNGGDLKMGLPLQSVNQADKEIYHQPLRLSVLVQAPTERVELILRQNEHLKTLLDNEWIYLLVMDPLQENRIKRYKKDFKWDFSDNPTSGKEEVSKQVDTPVFEEVLS